MRVALELPPLSSVDQYSLRPRIESSTVLFVCVGGEGAVLETIDTLQITEADTVYVYVYIYMYQ